LCSELSVILQTTGGKFNLNILLTKNNNNVSQRKLSTVKENYCLKFYYRTYLIFELPVLEVLTMIDMEKYVER
jgi:hypothetical protein